MVEEKTGRWKDIGSAGKQLLLRHCPEVPTGIFPLFSVLLRADDPVILGVCIIYNPQGIYYGGTIAAPVMKTIFENVLPYLGIDKTAVVTEESKTE